MLGPPICLDCKVVYAYNVCVNEQGDECCKWYCPKCKKEDSTDYAFTISKELFDELFPEESNGHY